LYQCVFFNIIYLVFAQLHLAQPFIVLLILFLFPFLAIPLAPAQGQWHGHIMRVCANSTPAAQDWLQQRRSAQNAGAGILARRKQAHRCRIDSCSHDAVQPRNA
jgi:hypothetical protein